MDWLNDLQKLIKIISEEKAWGVLACSALKEAYREMLQVNDQVRFIYLKGTYQQIESRLNQRKNHYMPATLLQSQFDALEEPKNVLTIDISNSPETIIQIIRKGLSL
jgi:gluconokinase